MFDSKTLIFTKSSISKSIWDFTTDDIVKLHLTIDEVIDIEEKLNSYYRYISITNESAISPFRHNIVDLIMEFAADEFENSEDWISFAKCTDEELIYNVRSCFEWQIENRWDDDEE